MLTKILMGLTAATAIALLLVFNLLLSAKEANGKLQGAISEAGNINSRQAMVVQTLEDNRLKLLAGIDAERVRAQVATDALIASQAGLETAKSVFEGRLAAARRELSNEDLVCAVQPIPDSYVFSLLE